MKNRLLTLSLLTLLCGFSTKNVYGASCTHFEGTIENETQGVPNALITFYQNGVPKGTSISWPPNGFFSFDITPPLDLTQNVAISVFHIDYAPISATDFPIPDFSGSSSSCLGIQVHLSPKVIPTLPPGVTPTPDIPGDNSCGDDCDNGNPCPSAPNPCTFCYMPPGGGTGSGICADPGWIPPTPIPVPTIPCVSEGKLPTAVGCLPAKDVNALMAALVIIALGVSGGISFLLMLFGAFKIITSSGDPKAVAAGSELITSALAGLLLIIFSLFLLKLVGADILQIPGFAL